MPHDYGDDDQPGFGLRETIVEEASVNTSGGYSVPGTPFIIAPYRSLAVFVKPSGGGSFSVDVTWDQDGAAGGATAKETKASTLTDGETLIFRNHGVQVTDITITGSADTAYAVMPSDVDPLVSASQNGADPSSPVQVAPIFEIGKWGGSAFGGFGTLTQDALCLYGGRLDSSGAQGDAIAVRFGLSPKGSVWSWYITHTTGPDHGIAFFYLARLPDSDAFAYKFPPFGDPMNLLGEIDDANADFTYILGAKINCYSAALTRNVVTNFGFKPLAPFTATSVRVTGEPGAAMTTPSVDPSLNIVTTGDGGPGVYALKISMDDKSGLSTGYKLGIQSLSATREDAIWA